MIQNRVAFEWGEQSEIGCEFSKLEVVWVKFSDRACRGNVVGCFCFIHEGVCLLLAFAAEGGVGIGVVSHVGQVGCGISCLFWFA